jgi:hypothetical protein
VSKEAQWVLRTGAAHASMIQLKVKETIMSKVVCVDNTKRFYLPVDSIMSFREGTQVTEKGERVGVEVTYWQEDKASTYFVETWNPHDYCKSLQQHMNALM